VWAGSGCPGAYVAGTDYAAADKVSVAGTAYTAVYECAAAPNNLFCGKPLYEPGTGEYWETVWTALGSCSGSISPTSSPSFLTITDAGGCPDAWEAGVKYDGEDNVSKNGLVFQCKEAPFNGFCGQAGYEPMKVDDPSEHWKTAWTVVGHCSGTISPTSTPSFDPANHVGGCPDAWVAGAKYDADDNVTNNGLVFRCNEFPLNGFCGQAGYEPMKVGDEAEHWKTAWTQVGHCSGTISPTSSPSFDPANHVGGCPDEWVAGTNTAYEEGDMVSITVSTTPLQKISYTCKAWPWSGYCGLYAPNSGIQADQQGWTMNGGCSGTIAPTTAPSFGTMNLVAGGCPPDYDENNLSGIEAGDQVSLVVSAAPTERRVVYECKSGAVSAYCSNAAFIPGGQYSAMAWDLKGYCDGTISPTAAPTAYVNTLEPAPAPAACEQEIEDGVGVNKCYYEKDITTKGVTCTCSDADCPNPEGLTGNACKKDVTKTNCPIVNTFSSSTKYEAGDVVRIGTKKFQCKAWPYYLWCSNSGYEPSLEAGVWTDAWNEIGDCS